MYKYLTLLLLGTVFLIGCSKIPSTEEIDNDIGILDNEINEATANVQEYPGGLLAILANVRLEVLQSTKAMLEQKEKGLKRYIPISYSVDGKQYSPPKNKDELLKELEQDIEHLRNDLAKADKESDQYGNGLLGILSSTQAATIRNSIAFLEQKRLLIKHDIPYYSILPSTPKGSEPTFKPTPGKDIDKF